MSSALSNSLDPVDILVRPRNCSNEHDTPSAMDFLNNVTTAQSVLLSIATAFTVVVFILAFLQWKQVWRYVSNERRQNKLYYLIAIFPVSAGCCLLGMMIPRAAIIITSVGMFYFLLCFFVIVSLYRDFFGGRDEASKALQNDSRDINFQSPPCCCCLCCLPTATSSPRNLRRLEWLVLQAPIVRAFLVVANMCAVAEMRERALGWLHVSEMTGVLSLLFALFGVHTMARLCGEKLRSYSFMTLFRFVDLGLLFFSAQQPIIFENILLRFGYIECGQMLSAAESARFICNFVIVCEMFLMSALSTLLLAPEKTSLFDLYPSRHLPVRETEESILDKMEEEAQA